MDRLVKENEQSEVNRNNMGMKVSGEKGETEGRKGPGCDDASGRVLLAVWLVLMPLTGSYWIELRRGQPMND